MTQSGQAHNMCLIMSAGNQLITSCHAFRCTLYTVYCAGTNVTHVDMHLPDEHEACKVSKHSYKKISITLSTHSENLSY
jgi:hypothetical protein